MAGRSPHSFNKKAAPAFVPRLLTQVYICECVCVCVCVAGQPRPRAGVRLHETPVVEAIMPSVMIGPDVCHRSCLGDWKGTRENLTRPSRPPLPYATDITMQIGNTRTDCHGQPCSRGVQPAGDAIPPLQASLQHLISLLRRLTPPSAVPTSPACYWLVSPQIGNQKIRNTL